MRPGDGDANDFRSVRVRGHGSRSIVERVAAGAPPPGVRELRLVQAPPLSDQLRLGSGQPSGEHLSGIVATTAS